MITDVFLFGAKTTHWSLYRFYPNESLDHSCIPEDGKDCTIGMSLRVWAGRGNIADLKYSTTVHPHCPLYWPQSTVGGQSAQPQTCAQIQSRRSNPFDSRTRGSRWALPT